MKTLKKALALVIASAFIFLGYSEWRALLQRKQGLSSFFVRKHATHILEASLQLGRNLTQEEVEQLLMDQQGQGRDEWGHRFHYFLEPESQETLKSFVLISPGKDGVLDYSSDAVAKYFEVKTENVTGDFDRDLVNRDGENIVFALK